MEEQIKQENKSCCNPKVIIGIILLIIVGVAAILGFIWFAVSGFISDKAVCVMEAKQCPGGSYVGRIPPTCKFAQCPTDQESEVNKKEINTFDWQTYQNSEFGFEISYPDSWGIEVKDDAIIFTDKTQEDKVFGGYISPMYITIEYSNFDSLNMWFTDKFSSRTSDLMPEYEKLKLTNVEGIKIVDPATHGGCEGWNVFLNNSKIYNLHRSGPSCDYTNELFHKIISTLNFFDLDSSTTVDELTAEQDSQIPDLEIDISDWQIYRNEEYRFEVKYPGGWSQKNSGERTFLIIDERTILPGTDAPPGPFISISVNDNSSGLTVTEWRQTEGGREIASTQEKDIIIDNNPVTQYIDTVVDDDVHYGPTQWEEPRIYLTAGNLIYIIEWIGRGGFPGRDLEVLTAITKSIKIVNNPPDSNWQTYRNEELGFEFKYLPDDYKIQEHGGSGFYQVFLNPNNGTGSSVQIYNELSEGHCHLNMCDKPTISQLIYNNVEWDYLGSNTYCDAGHCGTFEVIYRAEEAGRMYYVKSDSKKKVEETLFTFKFIKPEVDISDWQKYRNEEFGFEFNYPQEWINNQPQINQEFGYPLYLGIIRYNEANEESEGPMNAYPKSALRETKQKIENKEYDNIIEIDNKPVLITTDYFPPGGAFYREIRFFIGDDMIKLNVNLPPGPFNWSKDREIIEEIRRQIESGKADKTTQEVLNQFDKVISSIQFSD